ncbi:hypothetical protein Tco_0007139 [Tanacetum coccineum]
MKIKQRIQAARDRQKTYADVRRKPLEFQVGDRVMLKVSPWKGVIHLGKRGKLNPRYIGPFKKCLFDEPLAILLDELHIDDKLHFVEEPVEIMDCEVKQLKQSCIPIIKVRWNSRRGPEFTWEREDQFQKKYPHLFAKKRKTAPSTSGHPRKSKEAHGKDKAKKQKSIFKQAVEQKFKEYDQKLEALSSINVPKAMEEAVQAKINLLTTPSSITTDDLSEMDLKLKLLNKMYRSKYFKSHDTHHKLYDLLYESIYHDQESLDAHDTEPSFKKRPHDHQDPPNDREGEKRKKRRKDTCEPSSRSSKKDKAPMDSIQEDIPKSGSVEAAKRKINWFDMLLKSNIDQNEDCIIGLLTITVAKKIKELIKKDELTIADLEGVGLEMLKRQYKNDVKLEYHVQQLKAEVLEEAQWNNGECDVSKPQSFEQHMSKSTKHHIGFYNNDFYYLANLSTGEKYTTSLTKHFTTSYHTEIIEDMIPDRWRIDQKIPYTTSGTGKGVVYVNQHNMKSLMKLNEVNKFYDGTLLKVQENMLKMVNENVLGHGNKRLDNMDWSKNDIKRSNEMLKKIDMTLKLKERLRRRASDAASPALSITLNDNKSDPCLNRQFRLHGILTYVFKVIRLERHVPSVIGLLKTRMEDGELGWAEGAEAARYHIDKS